MPRTRPEPVRPFRLDFEPLARLRRGYNITQGDLAKSAGVSRWTIWRLETNGGNPSIALLVSLARALGTVMDNPNGRLPVYALFTVIDE